MKQSKWGGIAMWGMGVALMPVGCGSRVELGDDSAGGNGGAKSSRAGTKGQLDEEVGARAGQGGSGQPIVGAGASGPGVGGSFGAPTTCPATCEDSTGPSHTIGSVEEFQASVVGKWLICSGKEYFPAPANVVGVEYAPAEPTQTEYQGVILRGSMFYLVEGASGPERGSGSDYELTYDVSPQDAQEGLPQQLNMHPAPNSGFGGGFDYSPCPRQWHFRASSTSPETSAVLVPLE